MLRLTKLKVLDHDVRNAVARIPINRWKVISTHDAADDIMFPAPEGLSTETEQSARDVATIIGQIKNERIPAVFLENVSDPRIVSRIASETGAAIAVSVNVCF